MEAPTSPTRDVAREVSCFNTRQLGAVFKKKGMMGAGGGPGPLELTLRHASAQVSAALGAGQGTERGKLGLPTAHRPPTALEYHLGTKRPSGQKNWEHLLFTLGRVARPPTPPEEAPTLSVTPSKDPQQGPFRGRSVPTNLSALLGGGRAARELRTCAAAARGLSTGRFEGPHTPTSEAVLARLSYRAPPCGLNPPGQVKDPPPQISFWTDEELIQWQTSRPPQYEQLATLKAKSRWRG